MERKDIIIKNLERTIEELKEEIARLKKENEELNKIIIQKKDLERQLAEAQAKIGGLNES